MNTNPFDDSYPFWYNLFEPKSEGPEPEEDPNFVSKVRVETLCGLLDKGLDELTVDELKMFCARMILKLNKK